MEVLALLASRAGQVVSKEEINAAVWSGDAVEDTALAHCVSEIRRAFGDDPRKPRYIETLPKRGYRLIAPVVREVAENPTSTRRPGPETRWVATACGILLVLAALLTHLWSFDRGADAEAARDERPSLAVLGFLNLSGEPGAEWLATALTEMLTTELAVSEGFRAIPGDVVARSNHELSLTGGTQQLTAASRSLLRQSLGVDYVVLGSYLASGPDGGHLRLDLQVVENRSGEILAAVVETGGLGELSDLVLLAGMRLRGALGESTDLANLRKAGSSQLPADPLAARLYYQGLIHLRRFEAAAAVGLLERAIDEVAQVPQIHLSLADAWSLLGYDQRAIESASRALALADGLPRESRLWLEARGHGFAARWRESGERLQALHLLDPDNLEYGVELARVQLRSGQTDKAISTVGDMRRRVDGEHHDPRLALIAAAAAARAGEHETSRAEAVRARDGAQRQGATLVVGKALLVEAEALHTLGKVKEAESALEHAKLVFAELEDRNSEALAVVKLAAWLDRRGEFERAAAAARDALGIFETLGNRAGTAGALRQLATQVWRSGQASEGEEMFQRALATYREIGDRAGEAETFSSWAISAASYGGSATYGKDRSACELFDRAQRIHREIADRDGSARALSNLGRCALLRGDITRAVPALQQAEAIFDELGIRNARAIALYNLGFASEQGGDPAGAEAAWHSAVEIFRQLDNNRMLAACLGALGAGRLMANDLPAARELAEESLELRRQLGNAIAIADALGILARVRLAAGEAQASERLARDAVELTRESPAAFYHKAARKQLAFQLFETGQLAAARALVDQHQSAFDLAALWSPALLDTRILYARILAATGDPKIARRLLLHGLDLARNHGLERLRLETELALVEVDLAVGSSSEPFHHLQALERDLRRRGYERLALRADSLRGEILSGGSGPVLGGAAGAEMKRS